MAKQLDGGISWCDYTFNPWWGCQRVSPACDHCYAEAFAKRVGYSETGSQFPIWGKDEKRRLMSDGYWGYPRTWNDQAGREGKRYRVFAGSQCDVMENDRVAGERGDGTAVTLNMLRERLYEAILETPNIDWLLTTKRPQNFRRLLPASWLQKMPRNVWLITTVESQAYTWRIDEILKIPAVVHGISYEPALGPLDVWPWLYPDPPTGSRRGEFRPGLSWLIAGGESGPGARAPKVEWFRDVRDQCKQAGVAFHFKQHGDFAPVEGAAYHIAAPTVRLKKKDPRQRFLDGAEYNEFPQPRAA